MSDVVTIDRLLAERWYAAPEQYGAMADFTIEGRRLGSEPYRFIPGSPHESRVVKDQGELLMAAQALVHLGHRGAGLRKRESPDFAVHFADGGRIGLEIAEVVQPESKRFENAVRNMHNNVRDAVATDARLVAALGNRYVNFSMWRCPSRSAERRIVSEILEYLCLADEGDVTGRRVTSARFPELTAHWAHVYVSRVDRSHVDVSGGASTFDPCTLANVALKVLERKRIKARTIYDRSDPLWLVMIVTDLRGTFGASLDLLARYQPDISPFEQVVFYDPGRALVWTADGLRKAI